MNEFDIPSIPQVPSEASDLTRQELADLTPAKRSVFQYEREIDFLKQHASYLQGLVNAFQIENAKLLAAERDSNDTRVKLEVIRRSKLEMFVAFAIGSCLVAVGGGLLGSFPATSSSVPWQHVAGWACIVLGGSYGLLSRLIIQFVLHRLPKIAEEWMQ
jgi:hypothetical protein